VTDAAVTLRVSYGTNAGTESASQTGIVFCAADALSGSPVAPGSVSYERWMRLALDTANSHSITALSFTATANLPTGVTIKYGVTDTPATPINTTSTIATHLLDGDHVIWDTNTYDSDNDRSRYLVLQMVVASSATSGAIPQDTLTFGWAQS
jgi:hypothetical protein